VARGGGTGGSQAAAPWSQVFGGLAAFVVLGLPDGMLGTAWLYARHSFHAPLDGLGALLAAATLGAVLSSSVTGRLLKRLPLSRVMALATSVGTAGALIAFISPGFLSFAGAIGLLGVAAGAIDGGVNTWLAQRHKARLLNLVHGFYGLGTTTGPLVLTASELLGSWRFAYLVLLAAELAVMTIWLTLGNSSRLEAEVVVASTSGAAAPRGRSSLAIFAGLLVFGTYTGLEVAGGQWGPSFSMGALGLSAAAAGLVGFGYWGLLSLVRVGLALFTRPGRPELVARGGMIIGLVASLLIWPIALRPVALSGLLGLSGALAGVFPALIVLTPRRLGASVTHYAVGWQVAAANIGGATLSGVVGVILEQLGWHAFGPALSAIALCLVALNLVFERLAGRSGHAALS